MNKRMKIFLIVTSMVVFIFATAFVLFQPEDPTDVVSVLTWLASVPGALFVAGTGLAFLVEKFPQWGTWIKSEWRPWIVLILTVGISYGARALLGVDEFVGWLAPVYAQLYAIIAAWIGSQFGYAFLKRADMRALRA